MSSAWAGPGEARILDRGYRPYTGRRLGVRGAVRTLVKHSVQRALGLRRSVWAKVLPVLVIVISYVPAIVFVGITAFVPERDLGPTFQLPSYGSYFGYVASAVILFVAFVAPEVLCTDRRTGMLGIYLSSPLTRSTYLLAKAVAVALVLAFVTIGPPLLMLVASIIQGVGPDGPGGVVLTVVRVVGAGAVISVVYTAVSLGVSSLTDRKAFATAGLIMLFLVSAAVSGTLAALASVGSSGGNEQGPWFLLNLFVLPFEVVSRIHGETGTVTGLSTVPVLLGALAWGVLGGTVAWLRYRTVEVTK